MGVTHDLNCMLAAGWGDPGAIVGLGGPRVGDPMGRSVGGRTMAAGADVGVAHRCNGAIP